jgi:GWxTD domain-containing protein
MANVMLTTAAAALVLAASGTLQGSQQASTIEVVAKRFARGDATLVDGFCRVPFGMLTLPSGAGAGRSGVYRMQVVVRDSLGTLLHESGWSQSVAAEFLEVAGASTIEHFTFSLADGRYTLLVSVTDSVSGAMQESSVELVSLDPASRASDLLLSSEMRRASGEQLTAAPGEVQKGSIFLASSTKPVLTPRQPDLYYYLELYPGQETTLAFTTRVVGTDGATLTSTAPAEITVGAAGGVVARSVSLAGLPEGDYRLEVTLRFPDGSEVREAPFHMAGFDTEQHIAEVTARQRVDDPFAELTEARLDSLYAPLMYLQDGDERGVYEGLSLEGKRNYMRQFWEKRDPTPGTPANEYRVAYYAAFGEANRRFRESGAGDVPGWRTDRGRIFLKYGEAEQVLSRPNRGMTPPYEVWKYTRPRNLKFLFLDETGLGNYALIYTNDRFEVSRPNWQELLGNEQAVDDVERF